MTVLKSVMVGWLLVVMVDGMKTPPFFYEERSDGKVVGGGGWYEDTTILPLTERGMMVEGAEGRTCPGVSW